MAESQIQKEQLYVPTIISQPTYGTSAVSVQPIICGRTICVSYYVVVTATKSRMDLIAGFDLPSSFKTNFFDGTACLRKDTNRLEFDRTVSAGETVVGELVGII